MTKSCIWQRPPCKNKPLLNDSPCIKMKYIYNIYQAVKQFNKSNDFHKKKLEQSIVICYVHNMHLERWMFDVFDVFF